MSDKIKTLSQAIRLGASFRPQCTHQYMDYHGKSCAIGAALEVVAEKFDPDASTHTDALIVLAERFPYVSRRVSCPLCSYLRFPLRQLCEHLNDQHEWTRERIADHVAEIEKDLGIVV